MNKEDMMKGRGLVKGIAEGEALVSSKRQDTHLSAGKGIHQRSHMDAGGSQVRKRT